MACVFRSVLTRAELEALPLDNHLKEDVAKGKVRILLYIGFYFTATRTAYILVVRNLASSGHGSLTSFVDL